MTYRKNKNRNLCQVRTLCQKPQFRPQVARGFVYFVFMFIKLIFIQKWAIPLFIHTGVWTTKFLKPIRPGKNDCLAHKPHGIES